MLLENAENELVTLYMGIFFNFRHIGPFSIVKVGKVQRFPWRLARGY